MGSGVSDRGLRIDEIMPVSKVRLGANLEIDREKKLSVYD